VVAFRSFLRTTDLPLLWAACALFAVSLLADRFWPGQHLLEDGAKFLGIVAWSTYFVGSAVGHLRSIGQAGSRQDASVR